MPVDNTHALTASGERVSRTRNSNPLDLYLQGETGIREMQEQAWKYFDKVGEVPFVGQSLIGNRIKKYAFFPAWENEKGDIKPLADVDHGLSDRELDLINTVFGTVRTKAGGAPEFWSLTAENTFVGAEASLILEPKRQYFDVVSPLEVKNSPGGGFTLDGKNIPVTRLFRIWLPHPKKPSRPYTPLFSSFGTLDDIYWMTRYLSQRTRNRLVQNDILVLPNSITPPDIDPARSDAQNIGPQDKLNNFESAFRQLARENISLSGNNAPMPMIVFAPDGTAKDVSWITAEHKIDPSLLVYLHQLRERFANNVSVPTEMVTGLASANHWGAATIEDDLEYSHIGPLANTLSMSVTLSYFRPAIRAIGEKQDDQIFIPEDKLSRIRIGYSSLRKSENPDYVRNILRAYDLGVVGEEPVADALGIPRNLILTAKERAERLEARKGNGDSNESAPSRQQDQRNQPKSAPADEDRSRDGFNNFVGLLSHEIHRTAGNRLLNWANANPDIADGLQLASDPAQVGRYAGRSTLAELGKTESSLWKGMSDRIKDSARFYSDPQEILDNLTDISESIQNGFWS